METYLICWDPVTIGVRPDVGHGSSGIGDGTETLSVLIKVCISVREGASLRVHCVLHNKLKHCFYYLYCSTVHVYILVC